MRHKITNGLNTNEQPGQRKSTPYTSTSYVYSAQQRWATLCGQSTMPLLPSKFGCAYQVHKQCLQLHRHCRCLHPLCRGSSTHTKFITQPVSFQSQIYHQPDITSNPNPDPSPNMLIHFLTPESDTNTPDIETTLLLSPPLSNSSAYTWKAWSTRP